MHIRNLFLRVFPDACGAYANSPNLAANCLERYAKEAGTAPGEPKLLNHPPLWCGPSAPFFCLSTGGIILDTGQTYPNGFLIVLFMSNLGCGATPQKVSTGEVARSVKGVKPVKNDMRFKSMPR